MTKTLLLPFNSPADLERKCKALLAGYEKANKMAKNDLKRVGIPFKSTKYDIDVQIEEVRKRMKDKNADPELSLNALLRDSIMVRAKAEAMAGIVVVREDNREEQKEAEPPH